MAMSLEPLAIVGEPTETGWLVIQHLVKTLRDGREVWRDRQGAIYSEATEKTEGYGEAIDALNALRRTYPRAKFRIVSISQTVLNY